METQIDDDLTVFARRLIDDDLAVIFADVFKNDDDLTIFLRRLKLVTI